MSTNRAPITATTLHRVTTGLTEAIVSAEQLRVRAGGRDWNPEQIEDATRILVEAEGEIADLLGAPISPGAARVEDAPILDDGLVCPRWPVHTVTSINDTVVDDTHPMDEWWLLEDGYLRHTDPSSSLHGIPTLDPYATSSAGHAYLVGTVRLGYRPGWGDVPAIRSMLTKVALARVLNVHDDTMLARDLQAEAPPPMREPTAEEIRTKLGKWRWLQVTR